MIINHNMMAVNSNRKLGVATNTQSNLSEKLSSGYRINRASDDAAGLSISEKMRSQIRGLEQAARNAQDGISYIQTAEGALNEVHALMQRGRELCVQAANDTYVDKDREAIQKEIDNISKEIDRIARTTEFNKSNIFDYTNAKNEQASRIGTFGLFNGKMVEINSVVSLDALDYGEISDLAKSKGKDFTEAELQAFAQKLKENVPKICGSIQAALPDADPALASGLNIGLQLVYNDNNVLASCGSNGKDYTLVINMKYLEDDASGIIYSDDLVGTLAHELMHGVMFDMVTNGMLGSGNADEFPMWFIEGAAQAIGGGADYLAFMPKNGTDVQMEEWLADMTDTSNSYNAYAQGYIGTMYLGYVASGETSLTSGAIAEGLNKILKDIADGYSLSQSIAENTNGKYNSLADFEKNMSKDAVQFARDYLVATGTGSGSIAAPNLSDGQTVLDESQEFIFFVLDIVEGGLATNDYAGAGVNPYTGGGASKTNGTRADGTINPDAQQNWGGGSISGGVADGGTSPSLGDLNLQIGANAGQLLGMIRWKLSSEDMGIEGVQVDSSDNAGKGIESYDKAVEKVSNIRSYYGALQNRLEHAMDNINNVAENTQAAESRIRDANIAEMMMRYSANNIVQQAAQAMLAQANQLPQNVLTLLQ